MSIKFYVPNQKFIGAAVLLILLQVFALVSCKSRGSKHNQGSEIEGFSANNSTLTKNAAIMMTAYGSTQIISSTLRRRLMFLRINWRH